MIITKIYIKSFGTFEDYTFTPCNGLNVIYAPNESGKTTLLDFVRYMFYGASQRKKHDGMTFKEKYMPWNGYEIGGSIEFSADGKNYFLTRSDGVKPGEKSCRLFKLATGEELPNITEPGREFLRLSESAFCDSCFIGDVRSISEGNSNGELMNLVSGLGVDEASYTKVRKSLADTYAGLSSSKRAGSELNLVNSAIRECEDKITALEAEQTQYQKILDCEKDIGAAVLKLEHQKKEYILKAKSQRLSRLISQKNDEQKNLELLYDLRSRIGGKRASATDEEKEFMLYACPNGKLRFYTFFSVASVVLTVLSVMLIFLNVSAAVFIALSIASGLASVFFACKYHTCKRTANNKLKRQKEIFDKFCINSYNEYIRTFAVSAPNSKEECELSERIEFSKSRIACITEEMSGLGTNGSTEYDGKENFVETNSFTNEDLNGIISKMDVDIAKLRIRQERADYISQRLADTVSEIGSLQEEYKQLQRKKTSLNKQIKVYEYAMRILDAAFEEMNVSVAPALMKSAHDIFSSVVGSRYESIAANEKFSSAVMTDGDFRSSAYLSGGTRDALDFALRLAVVSIISDPLNPLPLFMDDSFSAADDERCHRFLELILNNSAKYQTFFTTCRSREGLFFKDNPDVNTISIQKG